MWTLRVRRKFLSWKAVAGKNPALCIRKETGSSFPGARLPGSCVAHATRIGTIPDCTYSPKDFETRFRGYQARGNRSASEGCRLPRGEQKGDQRHQGGEQSRDPGKSAERFIIWSAHVHITSNPKTGEQLGIQTPGLRKSVHMDFKCRKNNGIARRGWREG